MTAPRVVLDTNVVVSALVFSDGRLAWLRAAWQSGRVRPLVSQPIARELIRVLEYPKFRLEPNEREILLGDYLPACEVIRVSGKSREATHCRDPHDRMFLELALAGNADFVVTGDSDLLALESSFPIPIITAEKLRDRILLSLSERAPPGYVAVAPVPKKLPRKRAGDRAQSAR